nr:nitrite reductase large subunit [Candidatus Pantoea persica]
MNDPTQRARFAHFINSPQRDPNVQWVAERGQHRPAWPEERITITLIAESEA